MLIQIPSEVRRHLNKSSEKVIAEQLHYICPAIQDYSLTDEGIQIHVPEGGSNEPAVSAQIQTLVQQTVKSFRKVKEDVLFSHEGTCNAFRDPFPSLVESRQVIEGCPGTFSYQGEFLQVMQNLDRYFREYALSISCIEQAYPTTVPNCSMKANSYLANFPHHALMVASLHQNFETLSDAADSSESDDALTNLAPSRQMLAPTVCYHCFETLKDRELDQPDQCFTGIARCHRNEGRNMNGLARLQTFTMREIIFVGTVLYVEQLRRKITEHAKETMKRWNVSCRLTTACDPFFATVKGNKRSFQSLMGLKWELQLLLPHSDSWISSASFNNHKNSLVDAYAITCGSGTPVSGCVGYGYERMAYALYSQFGNDPNNWPSELQKDLKHG